MRLLSDTAAWFSSVRVVLALGAAALAGCTEVESESETGYEPSKLRKTHVEFTPEGAKRTGLRTEAVERTSRRVSVPYAALLYDPEGKTWTFVKINDHTFQRQPVTVDHITGDTAFLTEGPKAGSEVVVIGAAELYGVEEGVGDVE